MSDYKNLRAADFEYHRRRRAHFIVRSACAIWRVTARHKFEFVGDQITD